MIYKEQLLLYLIWVICICICFLHELFYITTFDPEYVFQKFVSILFQLR